MKMTKRRSTLSILLCLVVVLSIAIPQNTIISKAATIVNTWDVSDTDSSISATLDSDGVLTISGTGKMMDYSNSVSMPWNSKKTSIKEVVIGEGVTSIGSYAFNSCKVLKSIIIPESVTSIGSSAFGYCTLLTNIELPKGITKIESGVFSYCESLTGIKIPEGVTTIGLGAFDYCKALISVSIPKSVTSIGQNVFYNCTSLTNIELPEGITTLGSNSFRFCTALESINIPKSIIDVGGNSFKDCTALKDIYFNNPDTSIKADSIPITATIHGIDPSTAKDYALENNIPFEALSNGTSGKSWISGDTTVTLDDKGVLIVSGNGSMSNYTSSTRPEWLNPTIISDIKSVVVEDGVTDVGNYSFYTANNIAQIDIGKDVKYYGDYSFSMNSDKITEFNFNDSTEYIGTGALSTNTGLVTVKFPQGLDIVRNNTFASCIKLSNITLDNVKTIEDGSFSNCKVFNSPLPAVETIGSRSLMNCINFNQDLSNVIEIGEEGLIGCTNFNGKMPKIETLGNQALYMCKTYNQDLPNIKNIGSKNFMGNTVFNGEVPLLEIVGDNAFSGCTSFNQQLKNLKTSGKDSFYRTSIEGVLDLSNADTIGSSSFSSNKLITSLIIGKNATSVDSFAFLNCTGLTDVYIYSKEVDLSGKTIVPTTVIIHGYMSSTAEEYANTNSITFIPLDGEPEIPESIAPSVVEQTKTYNKTDLQFTVDFGKGDKAATTVSGVMINSNVLVKNTDYSLSDNTLTINKSYIDKLGTDNNYNVSVKFNDANNTTIDDKLFITIPKEIMPGVAPSVDIQGLTYNNTDISYDVNLGDEDLKATTVDKVYVNGVALAKTYWAFDSSTSKVTLNNNYLSKLRAGSYTIGFLFDDKTKTFIEDNCSLDVEETKDDSWVNTSTSVLNITWQKGTLYDLLLPTGIQNASGIKSLIINDDVIEQEGYSFDITTGIIRIKAEVMNRYETGTSSMIANFNIGSKQSILSVGMDSMMQYSMLGASLMGFDTINARASSRIDCGIVVSISDKGSSGLVYTKDEATGNITIKDKVGNDSDIIIPEEIDGAPVKGIDGVGNGTTGTITIPDSVEDIKPGVIQPTVEIIAPSGSAGENYANGNGNQFTPIEGTGNGGTGGGNDGTGNGNGSDSGNGSGNNNSSENNGSGDNGGNGSGNENGGSGSGNNSGSGNGSNDGNGTGDTTENENTGAGTTDKPTTDVSVDAGNNSDIDLPFDKDIVGDVIINNDKNNIIGSVDNGLIHIDGSETSKLPEGSNDLGILLPDGSIIDSGYTLVVSEKTNTKLDAAYLSIEKVIYKGSSFQLNLENLSKNATITFKSSNTSVASISKTGVIKAKKAGKSRITITINQNGKEYVSIINVVVPKKKGKTISEKPLARVDGTTKQPSLLLRKRLVIGKTFNVKALNLGDGKVTYTTSNKKIVSVSKNGTMKPLKSGTATVTVTITKNNVKYTYKLKCVIGKN